MTGKAGPLAATLYLLGIGVVQMGAAVPPFASKLAPTGPRSQTYAMRPGGVLRQVLASRRLGWASSCMQGRLD